MDNMETLKKKPTHELVLGMTGSGKTVFSRGALIPSYQDRMSMIIVDTKHDPNDKLWQLADYSTSSPKVLIKLIEKGYHVYYIIDYNSEEERWSKFNEVCHIVANMKGQVVTYVNEAGDVMDCVHMPFWFDDMLRKGRGLKHWAIVESQRPSLIVHPNLFNNVGSFWLFRCGTKDRSAIKKWFDREDLETLGEMEEYSFMWSDGFQYKHFPKLNMEALRYDRTRSDETEPERTTYLDTIGIGDCVRLTEDLLHDAEGSPRDGGDGKGGDREIQVRLG